MLFESVCDAIGHTPLVRLRVPAPPGVTVHAKLEMQNLFGMKDRVARHIIEQARRSGALREGAPIVESSSGTMALGVALVGRSLGHDVHIVTDPRIDPLTLAKLRALGAHVDVVDAMSDHQGWQGVRLERLTNLMRRLPGAFWPQQYSNPDNPAAYRLLAQELVADLGTVDVLVGSVGSGGSLCGSARALRSTCPGLHVVGVDCVGSALFDQPDRPQRLQSGLGNSLQPKNLDRGLIDEVHWLNDHEAFAATRALVRDQQIFAGNTSGSVYRVLTDVAARAEPGARVVGIFPDRGDRYADTVYSDDHWDAQGLADLELAEAPASVRYGSVVTSWSRASAGPRPGRHRYLLFIESNTTGSGMMALRTARACDLHPVLLTSDPDRYGRVEQTGAEVVKCETGSVLELQALVKDRFRREELVGVTTTSDFYVVTAAQLAMWLALPGNSVESMETCRNKALMRERMNAEQVRQPRFAAIEDVEHVADAVGAVGLPCVVKPADDSGSNNVRLCATREEVAAHTSDILAVVTNVRGQPTARTVLVEEFLDAPEFSVEMFSWQGRAQCVGITAKTLGPTPHFVETRHIFPAALPPEVREEVVETVRRALNAAGVTMGATHTEVRLAQQGAAVIEVNPRPAGGMIPELISLATGVELVEQHLRVAADLSPVLAPTRSGTAGISFLVAERSGTLASIEGVDLARAVEGVQEVTVVVPRGSDVRPPRNAYDRLGHVIAVHDTTTQVQDALDAAQRYIHVLVRDHPDAEDSWEDGSR